MRAKDMLAVPRTTTGRYDNNTARLLSQERMLWLYRVEIERLERLASTGDDVTELLAVMRVRVRTLEAQQDLEWAVERANAEPADLAYELHP